MTSWSAKRRFVYGGSVVTILVILAGLVFFKALYTAPTCTDGAKNGEEKGVDCGGSCKNLCTSDTLNPVVLWSKIFNISGDVYSAVAYIENPNITSKNPRAQYEFKIFDTNNKLIKTVTGETSIPKNKKFAVFETGVVLKGIKAKSADFKFVGFSPWEKDTTKEPDLDLDYTTLLNATTSPHITGTIKNLSGKSINEIELVVLVQDNNENVVAASRSFVDNLLLKTSQDFVFTWPKPFNLGVEACTNPVDVSVALDKSGSMKSEGVNPPEPFTTVINTARSFVKNLKSEDQSAVTSFGTNSKQESLLSLNKDTAISAIDSLFLSTTTLEQTNITGGLTDSWNELRGERGRAGAKKVIVLLTDGIPTEPTSVGIADYPITSAQSIAKNIKDDGITIYTIGLGKNVSSGFLQSISTDEAHYFEAPTKETLTGIYSKIATNLCVKKPNAITVIFRTL